MELIKIIFTSDDVNPSFLDFWKKHLDPVKDKYPDFKVIAFVVPLWQDKEENKIKSEFVKWWDERKRWVTIGAHGCNHIKAECLASYEEQLEMMLKSKAILRYLLKFPNLMFKPPYYKWNSDSLFAAKKAGFRFFFVQDGILDLKTFNFFSRSSVGLIDSHCNPTCDMADRLDRIKFDKFMGSIFSNRIGEEL